MAEVFDSNNDGALDANDARFNEFRIWKDANSNGEADSGELRTLAAWGITAINLTSDGAEVTLADGTIIHGTTTATRTDGTTRSVADVALAYYANGVKTKDTNDGLKIELEAGGEDKVYIHDNAKAFYFLMKDSEYSHVVGGAGNDILDAWETTDGTVLIGGGGNDHSSMAPKAMMCCKAGRAMTSLGQRGP